MKAFKRLAIGAVAMAMMIAAGTRSAQASLVTINLQGVVSTVDEALGGTFSSGQTINLSYTFNTDTVARAGSNSTFATYDALTAFNFSIGGYSASSSAAPEIQVDNNPGEGNHDRYGVTSRTSDGLNGANVNGLALNGFSFRFDDSTDSVFSDALVLPTDPDFFNAFDSNQFFVFFNSPSTQLSAAPIVQSASITGVFRPVVPEPCTLALVGMGLSGLGFMRRRKLA